LPRSVLLFDQYGGSLPWVGARNTAFRTLLNAGRTVPISIYEEYLDFNRFAAPTYKESLKLHFGQKYRDKPIDLIVAFGPLALDYAVDLRAALWPGVAVVFGFVAEICFLMVTLAPTITFDALKVHLPSIHQYASSHAIFPIREIDYSYFPQGAEVLWTLAYELAGQPGAQLSSALFFVLFLIVIFRLARECGADPRGSLGQRRAEFAADLRRGLTDIDPLIRLGALSVCACVDGASIRAASTARMRSMVLLLFRKIVTRPASAPASSSERSAHSSGT
jgi:hypothetical protein